jgi:predicted Fe-S protein YdhL (DUF1289 family)
MAGGIKSPCTKKCVPDNGVCTGCRRTLEEIAEWADADDETRRKILSMVRERKRQENKKKGRAG